MSAVYIALPVALPLACLGVLAFIWSVRTGQLDDLTTPGVRMLLDDDEPSRGLDATHHDHGRGPAEIDGAPEGETRT
jgi:cbb3-type cytochrome oxidase maturation protein